MSIFNTDNINSVGITAVTISATTYYGLPKDVYVTGGTYNNSSGYATFSNNTGGTFSVSGFTTGLTTSNYVVQGKLAADQSIPHSSDTVISFVDDYDPQNWWNSSSKKFTPNIGGYYLINGGAWMESSTGTTGQSNFQARVNGSTFAIVQSPNNNQTGESFTFSKLIFLNGTTDYVDFTFYQNTGVSRNILQGTASGSGTWFSASLLAGSVITGSTGGGSSTFTGGTVTGPTNFLDGLTSNTITTSILSATTYYGLPTSKPYVNNKLEAVTGTTVGDNFNTGIIISATPILNSYVGVTVNGLNTDVGNGVINKDCYFSSNGTSGGVRSFSSITIGDFFMWNTDISGYYLDNTDTVSIYYNITE